MSLELPLVSLGDDLRTSNFYGAAEVAAKYCGLSGALPPIPGVWMHGWVPPALLIDPAVVLCAYNPPNPSGRFFVATAAQRDFLREREFLDVHAIGLPISYVAPSRVHRTAGSLLVMPPHSTGDTHRDWDEEAYADAIDAIRKTFSKVVVCIHPACWRRGYWVQAFRRRGYEVIKGIGGQPEGIPLENLRDLLSSFEFVTTNGYGSHIVYAAYFGCRVSVYGPWAEDRLEYSLHVPAFAGRRRIFDEMFRLTGRDAVVSQFPFLACSPGAAPDSREWASQEVGEQNRLEPSALRALFGWRGHERVLFAVRGAGRDAGEEVRRWTPEPVKQLWRRIPGHPDRVQRQEEDRLRSMPPMTRGVSCLLGAEVEFADAPSFLRGVRDIFQRQIFRFATDETAPLLIACGAGVGLSVLYLKALFPKARVIAFEPDPDIFELLSANVRRSALEDIELRQEAAWNETTTAFFRPHATGGRLTVRDHEPGAIAVRTIRLRDLLDVPVDFLQIDVGGAEIDILDDCEPVLSNVRRIFITGYSPIDRPQHLDRTLAVLRNAGMRVHLSAIEPSATPFLARQILDTGIDALDMATSIWAYRE